MNQHNYTVHSAKRLLYAFLRVILVTFAVLMLLTAIFGTIMALSDPTLIEDETPASKYIAFPIAVLICLYLTYLPLKAANKLKHKMNDSEYTYTSCDCCPDYSSDQYTIDNPNDVEYIDYMEGHDFEYFCAGLLMKNGFTNVNVTPGSGDQGVDILAEKFGVRYAIQCKNYASKLGNTPIQEVNAGKMFYKCDIGVVLTNSTFTPAAIELANSTNTRLWDRTELQRLMTEAARQEST